ncbi:MAG: ABC-2 type transport system permease protein [Glaciecola sp.]|jgi:ABC-2 type transport system permease protein
MTTDAVTSQSAARIHEQGYRRYEGTRLPPNRAIRAVFVHTLRFILGFKRKARAKIVPVGVIALATLPAVMFSAALMILPDFAQRVAEEILPGPEIYVGGTIFLTFIAAAMAGPAALCGDRLHGSLALYLASPLTRRTYLLGKALAVFAFLAAVTVIPSVVYVLGIALAGVQDQSIVGVGVDVFQVVLAGFVIALGYCALSMAAASLTDRQGAASGLVVGFAMVTGIVGGVLVLGMGLPDVFRILDFNSAMTSAAIHVHGAGEDAEVLLGAAASVGAAAVWILGLAAFVVWRYERLQVTR